MILHYVHRIIEFFVPPSETRKPEQNYRMEIGHTFRDPFTTFAEDTDFRVIVFRYEDSCAKIFADLRIGAKSLTEAEEKAFEALERMGVPPPAMPNPL